MTKDKYLGYKILAVNNELLQVSHSIIDNKYKVTLEFKNTKRNYVALIEVNGKNYILKSPRNEFVIPQRKLFTLFKQGETMSTFINIRSLMKEGINFFAEPLAAINKRKRGMIIESHLIMEYVPGNIASTDMNLIIDYIKKMHSIGIYHGDCNPGNFILAHDGMKIIDTQAKKMIFGRYRSHYDMITLKMDSYNEMEYPYSKDIWYILAYGIKAWKRFPAIKKIRAYKRKLREKGWRI